MFSVTQIGIQIRIGDWQLVSGDRYWFHPQGFPYLFDHYFDCAEEIEGELRAEAVIRREARVKNGSSSHQLRVVW